MSMALSPDKFATILHVFSQEMSLVTSEYGGYVLKYVGDAIIALFPAEYDSGQASKNAVDCAKRHAEDHQRVCQSRADRPRASTANRKNVDRLRRCASRALWQEYRSVSY
jgi:class 3 adenylate cyclase